RKVNDSARRQALAEYPLDPALAFEPLRSCVTEGVVNIDTDLRRVVLWWPNVQPVNNSSAPPPSLAFAAARAAAPDLLENSRIAGWSPQSKRPYISFLEPDQFKAYTVLARDLICSSGSAAGWRACSGDELKPGVRERTHSRIVVIGEEYPDVDRHDTVVGEMP